MNQKYEITKKVLELQGIEADEKRIKKTITTWWFSSRKKSKGGLRLTQQGFDCLVSAGIKSYPIKFEEPVQMTNELIIWIDQNIDCPFFLTNKFIYVFGERTAVQLVLFSGNIAKLYRAHKKFNEKKLKID